jgi:hypothetical protein
MNKIPVSQTLIPRVGLFRKSVEMQKNWKFKTGIALIIVSTLLFTSLLIVPFLDAGSKAKITITTVVIVIGEITFWVGGFLLGKELLNKYKAYLNPMNWFKKKTIPATVNESKVNETKVNPSSELF